MTPKRQRRTGIARLALVAPTLLMTAALAGARVDPTSGRTPETVAKEPSSPSHWREEANCGVSCCYVLLKQKGINVAYEAVASAIPVKESVIPMERRGSNLYAMKQGCIDLGLAVEAIHLTPSEFDAIRWPAIAHLYPSEESSSDNGHFVVVIGRNDHHVYVIDPETGGRVETAVRGDFFRHWSGNLLIPTEQVSARIAFIDILGYSLLLLLVTGSLAILGLSMRILLTRARLTLLSRAAVILVLVAAQGSGCRFRDEAGSLDVSLNSGFDLTAWNVEADLGTLPEDRDAVAEFPIQNTGSVEVRLELGAPSCLCALAKIGKERLAPGEQTILRVGLKSTGKPGLMEASVPVYATEHKWASTFRVRGVIRGSSFPTNQFIVSEDHSDGVIIQGTLVTEKPSAPCELSFTIPRNLDGIIRLSPPEISAPTPIDRNNYGRRVTLCIRPVREHLRLLPSKVICRIDVFVKAEGRERAHSIDLVVAPRKYLTD